MIPIKSGERIKIVLFYKVIKINFSQNKSIKNRYYNFERSIFWRSDPYSHPKEFHICNSFCDSFCLLRLQNPTSLRRACIVRLVPIRALNRSASRKGKASPRELATASFHASRRNSRKWTRGCMRIKFIRFRRILF